MKGRESGRPGKEKRVVISKGAQYHNPDVVTQLIGPRNIARVEINGVKTRALMHLLFSVKSKACWLMKSSVLDSTILRERHKIGVGKSLLVLLLCFPRQ